jgi:hypothetical protein
LGCTQPPTSLTTGALSTGVKWSDMQPTTHLCQHQDYKWVELNLRFPTCQTACTGITLHLLYLPKTKHKQPSISHSTVWHINMYKLHIKQRTLTYDYRF